MLIKDLSVSKKVKAVLKNKGFYKLYPPQAETIEKGILKGKNMIIAIPTAAGKTLPAELAMVNMIEKGKGKALYLVPLKALASEKLKDFKKWEKAGIAKVIQTSSDFDEADNWLDKYDLIISTNEKADSLFRHNPKWLNKIKIIVIDEIHLIDSEKRGPTLEVYIAKIRQKLKKLQIIGLSATIPNAEQLAEWLNAELVLSEWRPVRLKEGVYYNGVIYYNDGTIEKTSMELDRPSHNLIKDTLDKGGQVLEFLTTRKHTVSQAKVISKITNPYLKWQDKNEIIQTIAKAVCSKSLTNTILGETLCNVVKDGAAFHHAGLSPKQRKYVEEGYKKKLVKVITATPTLAAGVNLPARRVLIIHQRYTSRGMQDIKVIEYKQMAGRAGRPGLDNYGEAILFARTEEQKISLQMKYQLGKIEPIMSKLNNIAILRTHLLAYIAQQEEWIHNQHIKMFFENTFYRTQVSDEMLLIRNINYSLKFLVENNFIDFEEEDFFATDLGIKVAQLYIDPMSAVIIKEGLKNASQSKKPFSLIGWTHLLATTPDFLRPYIRLTRGRSKDTPSELELALALYDKFENEMYRKSPYKLDTIDFSLVEEDPSFKIYLEALKVTLIMSMWVNEATEKKITQKFRIGPGDILQYINTYKWLFYSAKEIARILQYEDFIKPLGIIGWRVAKGIKDDILEIAKLKGIGRVRGRELYKAGYKTIDDFKVYTEEEAIKLKRKLEKVKGIGPALAKTIISQTSQIEIE